ncbi:N-acetylmuramic acid 6-phosphate etherase [Austwickia sp. TVS 96-490-7B]|uniref:N-acetylmuramic acid 6-phosphate etherase n=1 Tax=Austwickia sp. TVS 96-490-7B TaxID=2830843 RepID=UPI001C58254C|nr:N-acetylmuramic acid 6-phosphate etherase [Austwickia sp. TVS 96-490-7B]MBW3084353.1 N-acetylmuramic acid 6-phosphate etherase [Austwickia sp. TVS 96-490-7B]
MSTLPDTALAAGVLITGFPGTHLPDWLKKALDDGLAGVCLFGENTPDIPTTRNLTDTIRAHRSTDDAPLIVIDEEGGKVTRLQVTHGSVLPGAAALGTANDTTLTQECGTAIGHLLSLAGIDMNLAPCLDVTSDPDNLVIGTRSFGTDPTTVIRHGTAFATGLHAAHIACCGKHYPGHGATHTDSHLDLPVVTTHPTLLRTRDLAPFTHLLTNATLDAVMTGHLVVPHRGPDPASLSPWATQEIRATGFTGPILTDALGMRAITRHLTLGEACVRALLAGADLLLLDSPHHRDPHTSYRHAITAITTALTSGRLDRAALAASAARSAALRRQHLNAASPHLREDARAVNVELTRLGQIVTDRAVQARDAVSPPGVELTWSTEQPCPSATDLDTLDTAHVVEVILDADQHVAAAVRAVAPQIAAAADLIISTLTAGGVVHYLGAGTSGRLGVLDVTELLPTYHVGDDAFRAHLAGGPAAMTRAVEGAEDDDAAGSLIVTHAGPHDLIIGLTASGRTPYVRGALHEARRRGLTSILISTNPAAPLKDLADVAILPDTGPEVITGSTRMKAATAQKIVLNALSTAAMVRLGKTYRNLMIDMTPTNTKLRARSVQILTTGSGYPPEECARALQAADGDLRQALVALLGGIPPTDAGMPSVRRAVIHHPPNPDRIGDPSGIRSAAAALRAAGGEI